jgi:hypothetical protein
MQYRENYGSCAKEGDSCTHNNCCSNLQCDSNRDTPTCRHEGACYWKLNDGNTRCIPMTETQCNAGCHPGLGVEGTQWVKNTECLCPQDKGKGSTFGCEFPPEDSCSSPPNPPDPGERGACYWKLKDGNTHCVPSTEEQCYQRCDHSATRYLWNSGECDSLCNTTTPYDCEFTRKCPPRQG